MPDKLLLLTSKTGAEFQEIVAQADSLAQSGNIVCLLLIGDAVSEAIRQRPNTEISKLIEHASVFACLEDARTRGLEQKLLPSIKAVDYSTIVDLIMIDNEKIVSCV